MFYCTGNNGKTNFDTTTEKYSFHFWPVELCFDSQELLVPHEIKSRSHPVYSSESWRAVHGHSQQSYRVSVMKRNLDVGRHLRSMLNIPVVRGGRDRPVRPGPGPGLGGGSWSSLPHLGSRLRPLHPTGISDTVL